MTLERRMIVLVASALLLTAARTHAGFLYDTTVTFSPAGTDGTSAGVVIVPTSMNIGGVTESGFAATFGGSTIDLLGTSRNGFVVPGQDTLDVADLTASSTTPAGAAGDSFTLGYTLNLALTNNPPPGSAGSGNFAVSGILTMSDVNAGNGTITNTFTTPTSGGLNAGGIPFTAAINTFSPPTINGSPGSIGGVVDASPVPEPTCASLILLGVMPILRRTRRTIG